MRRLLLVFVLFALIAPAAPAAADTSHADRQLAWLLAVSQRLPASDAELAEHVAAPVLDAIGGPAGFNETLGTVAPLTTARPVERTPDAVTAVVDERSSSRCTPPPRVCSTRSGSARTRPHPPVGPNWTVG